MAGLTGGKSDDLRQEPETLTTEAVGKAAAVMGADTLNFIFVTDLHHRLGDNMLGTAARIAEAAKGLPLDFILCGGDIGVNGPKSEVVAAQAEIMQALAAAGPPLLAVKGNHDDNSIHDDALQLKGAANVIYPHETNSLMLDSVRHLAAFDGDGLYYYLDIPAKRTRVIVLDCIDIPYELADHGGMRYLGQSQYAFSDRQLNWFAHEALNLADKANWRVLIASHIAIIQDRVFGFDHPVANGKVLWSILTAFSKGTAYVSAGAGDFPYKVEVDYHPQGAGRVIGCLFGHVHFDQAVRQEGLTMISTLNANTHRDFPEAPERLPGTDSESAFDLMAVDFERSRLLAWRVGAGEDRSIPF